MNLIKKTYSKIFSIESKDEMDYLKYEKKSYSQSGEDLIIQFIFNELSISNPTFLDIGAHHPFYLNNTAIFYQRGCRGINIEPDPSLFGAFLEERPDDMNLNVGISDKEGELDFYIMNVPTLNTFSRNEAEGYSSEGDFFIKEVKKVKVKTVTDIIAQYNNDVFPQFLTLDAEGVDELVLKAIDFEKNKPIVICTETISFSSKGRGIKNLALIEFLKSKGYLHYADTNINSIFVDVNKWERI
jgi:FkbM family methyltransferase